MSNLTLQDKAYYIVNEEVEKRTPGWLYIGDKRLCQVVNWPPRNTERGWELDVLYTPESPVYLELLQRMRHCVYRVDDVEFRGLETVVTPMVTPEDEMAKGTLVFQHCVTVEESKTVARLDWGLFQEDSGFAPRP